MKIKIKRTNQIKEYSVNAHLLLKAFYEIKSKIDSSFTFDSGCRSGVCGSCAVKINGKEALACMSKVNDGDLIEPLDYHRVIRDLKVDRSQKLNTLKREKAFLKEYKEMTLTKEDEKLTQIESDCILCDSCYSACPVFAVNEEFLGPFALTRAYKYVVDKRLKEPKEIIDNIQKNGIWDCTLCGECTLVCPKGIDPKGNIIELRNISARYGYMDPNFGSNFGGFDFNSF